MKIINLLDKKMAIYYNYLFQFMKTFIFIKVWESTDNANEFMSYFEKIEKLAVVIATKIFSGKVLQEQDRTTNQYNFITEDFSFNLRVVIFKKINCNCLVRDMIWSFLLKVS